MSDVLDNRPRVGAEFFGKARDLRRRIEREDADYTATTFGLLVPLQLRLRKYPQRNLRPQMIADLVGGWRFMETRDFRTHIEARLERKGCCVVERRLMAGRMRQLTPGWSGEEPDCGITQVTLLLAGNRLKVTSQLLCTFSLHALARRYQRHFDEDVSALLYDMDLVAQVDTGKVPSGGYKICTDEDGGGWRGRMVQIVGDSGPPQRVLSIRTWMPE